MRRLNTKLLLGSIVWTHIRPRRLLLPFTKLKASKRICRNALCTLIPKIHSEKSRPFWPSQNESLRKIVFDNTLPIPVLRNSEDDKVRSFFVQHCIVYHNALYEKSPELKMNQKGVVEIARAPRPHITRPRARCTAACAASRREVTAPFEGEGEWGRGRGSGRGWEDPPTAPASEWAVGRA